MQLATLLLTPPPQQKPAFATPLSLSVPSRRVYFALSSAAAAPTMNAASPSQPPKSSKRNKRSISPARKRVRSRNSRTGPANDKWTRVQPGISPSVSSNPSMGPIKRDATITSATMEKGMGIGNHYFEDNSSPVHVPPPTASDLRPESCPALVLNADFSPLSYMPLSLWPWQEVVKAVFLDRVRVVATYDVGIRSPGMVFPLPSVISLKQYQPMASKNPAFTRFNVFLRDAFACQYCGRRYPTQDLTFDHVVPRCCGGRTNWTNVVTACVACNHAKGRFLLKDLKGMKLKRAPKEPSNFELQSNAKKFPPQYLHESWRDYIYWSQSMEVEK